jgi:hypothetical protein
VTAPVAHPVYHLPHQAAVRNLLDLHLLSWWAVSSYPIQIRVG